MAFARGDSAAALAAYARAADRTTDPGLVAFGEVGDPFDPEIHEAVMHDESDSVTRPTATTVMRPGYKHNDRLLRPAMVGVTDPTNPSAAEAPGVAPDAAAGAASGEAADSDAAGADSASPVEGD